MRSKYRPDVIIIAVFALVAVLAIVAPLAQLISPYRFLATFGGILFGPGALAYRLATGRRWVECLTVGVAIDVATVMVLGLALVSAHLWYPTAFELLIPLTAFLLSAILLIRQPLRSREGAGQQADGALDYPPAADAGWLSLPAHTTAASPESAISEPSARYQMGPAGTAEFWSVAGTQTSPQHQPLAAAPAQPDELSAARARVTSGPPVPGMAPAEPGDYPQGRSLLAPLLLIIVICAVAGTVLVFLVK